MFIKNMAFEAFIWYYDLIADEVVLEHLTASTQQELNNQLGKICGINEIKTFLNFDDVTAEITTDISENEAFIILGSVKQPEIIRQDVEIKW